jgi:Bacterial antitoxin of type II TA system, VapB
MRAMLELDDALVAKAMFLTGINDISLLIREALRQSFSEGRLDDWLLLVAASRRLLRSPDDRLNREGKGEMRGSRSTSLRAGFSTPRWTMTQPIAPVEMTRLWEFAAKT